MIEIPDLDELDQAQGATAYQASMSTQEARYVVIPQPPESPSLAAPTPLIPVTPTSRFSELNISRNQVDDEVQESTDHERSNTSNNDFDNQIGQVQSNQNINQNHYNQANQIDEDTQANQSNQSSISSNQNSITTNQFNHPQSNNLQSNIHNLQSNQFNQFNINHSQPIQSRSNNYSPSTSSPSTNFPSNSPSNYQINHASSHTPSNPPFQFNPRVLSYEDEPRKRATDLKTPAEYTLHIVFTQFVRHAERKLNVCLEFPLNEEPPIIELLSEGIDTQFDSIISLLGYIARRKPKPVIDSVMFWRKSKSEVALMAATELERALATAANAASASTLAETLPKVSGNNGPRAKRSLSLLRARSVKSHKRAQSLNLVGTSESGARIGPLDIAGTPAHGAVQAHETAVQAERKLLASIYILCRVLIEVVKQTAYDTMGADLSNKLEDIVYTQLKTTDPISTSQSLVRAANWNLFAELLGHMLEKSFVSVSDRFIADLEKMPVELRLEDEPPLHLLIHGMRYLRLTNYPIEVFEESADFVLSLAKFFGRARNDTIVYAYCEILSTLLFPLAGVLTAETNHPTWADATQQIFVRAREIWVAAGGGSGSGSSSSSSGSSGSGGSGGVVWGYLLSLMTAALCVSPKELFSAQWFQLIEDNAYKLRQKGDLGDDKATYVMCVARLVWVYIYRVPDTLNNTVKKLDVLFGTLFAAGKKSQWVNGDAAVVSAVVELVRIVGYQHLNYVLDNVLVHVVKTGFNGHTLEGLASERLMVAVRAYVAMLEDYEHTRRPPFPDGKAEAPVRARPFVFLARLAHNAVTHDELCRTFAVLLRLLDGQYGCTVWRGDGDGDGGLRAFQALHHLGLDFLSSPQKGLHVELFATLVEAVPWIVDAGGVVGGAVSFNAVVEMLVRNAVHPTARVSEAAVTALRRMATRKNPTAMLTLYAKIAFRLSDKPGPALHVDYLNLAAFLRLLKVYVELLGCWLGELRGDSEKDNELGDEANNDWYGGEAVDGPGGGPVDATRDELEWKTIVTVVEDIEGNGLFFLCSQDSKTRHYGVCILRTVEEFDTVVRSKTDGTHQGVRMSQWEKKMEEERGREKMEEEKGQEKEKSDDGKNGDVASKYAAPAGTRLIHLLDTVDFVELLKPVRRHLSVPERQRLTKLKGRRSILVKLAELDYGIDLTLWFRLYPRVLDVFFERCPMPVAMCRLIVCVRLVQMHEMVVEFLDMQRGNYTSLLFLRGGLQGTSTPPELVVNQWKLYLIFACCLLTQTNDQKILFPNRPTHGRKRLMQMFIQHQKITSARLVFRMALPLLGLAQPMVRDAVIAGMSCINVNIFRLFVESLPELVTQWDAPTARRDVALDRLRVEVVHILHNLTDRFRHDAGIYSDEWVVVNLVAVTKNVKTFLLLPAVQTDVAFQRLRRYFCGFLENLLVGLSDRADLERWFPFEARIACFNWLKEWCGLGPDAAIAAERYSQMGKDPQAQALLEVERRLLEAAALGCMGVMVGEVEKRLVVGDERRNGEGERRPDGVQLSFDVPALMEWIVSLLAAPHERAHEIGRSALRRVLSRNPLLHAVFDELVRQSCLPGVRSAYFPIFVEEYISRSSNSARERTLDEKGVEKELHERIEENVSLEAMALLALAAFLIGCDQRPVRSAAMDLINHIVEVYKLGSPVPALYMLLLASRPLYKRALVNVLTYLSTLRVDSAHFVSHLCLYANRVSTAADRADVFACLVPWLTAADEHHRDGAARTMVFDNLLELTMRYGHEPGVPALWETCTRSLDVLEEVLRACLERRSADVVRHAREIVSYLASNEPAVFDALVANLQPRLMVPKVGTADENNVEPVYPYHALATRPEKECVFSLGQLSMVFAVDLVQGVPEQLAVLLHVATVLMDHYLGVVLEQGVALMEHLVRAREPRAADSEGEREEDHEEGHEDDSNVADETLAMLAQPLWLYDDLNNDKRGARTPKLMDQLVRNMLALFRNTHPQLQEQWARVLLAWATTCAVRHIACRSFQVFRSLLSFLDQGMLKDMLHRLLNTISDETGDIQGFAMQILMTLNAITAELDLAKLIDFPQLFWLGVACLLTIHEQEFVEVLLTMSKFVSKIDLDAPDTVSCLVSTFPPKWEGQFEGLHHVILPGLRLLTLWDSTLKFLDKLNTLHDSDVIGMGQRRMVTALLSNMPRYLHALDADAIPRDVEQSALLVSRMAEQGGFSLLARILVLLAKRRFRSKKDFLAQTVLAVNACFFPEHASTLLVLLLGLLSNKIPWVKLETMALLRAIFPLVDLQRDEFAGVGADLILPLLRLLLTDYAEAALEVLDEVRVLSGSALDRDVLRMSFSNQHILKEYDRTATMFGVPDENGWGVPMPAITAATTRNNVHAVFSTCIVPTEEPAKEEEIEFHMEDYAGPDSVSAHEPDASLSNVWAALDDFDSFFTKDVSAPMSHQHSALMETDHSFDPAAAPMDLAPMVYDKKASVILNRSLARTQSNTSFKNSLADPSISLGLSLPVAMKRSYIPFRHSRQLQRKRAPVDADIDVSER